MLPLPRESMWRPIAWQGRYVPLMLRARMASSRSSGKSSAGLRNAVPALLTRTSTDPSSLTARSVIASTAPRSVTSQCIVIARPPCASIVAAVAAAPSSSMSTIAMRRTRLRKALGDRRTDPAASAGHARDTPAEAEEPVHESGRDLEARRCPRLLVLVRSCSLLDRGRRVVLVCRERGTHCRRRHRRPGAAPRARAPPRTASACPSR